MDDLYKEIIHHDDRSHVRVYRDYLTLYNSPAKAAVMRALESAGDMWISSISLVFDMITEIFTLDEHDLRAVLDELVEMGHAEHRYNGMNHTYQIRAKTVQRALNALKTPGLNS